MHLLHPSMVHCPASATLAGMIEAEAATRVGGLASLLECVRRGDVIVAEHRGRSLYYFPRVSFAKMQEWGVKGTSTSSQVTTAQAHKALREIAQGMVWQPDGEAKQSLPALEEPPPSDCIPEELFEELSAVHKDMMASVRAAERLMELLQLDGCSKFVTTMVRELQSQSEVATTLASEIAFMGKFRKAPKGNGPLSSEKVSATVKEAAECLRSLQELWRALKGLSASAKGSK